MNWEDECYLLSKRKFRENANIINVFTPKKGKVTGIVYGGNSRKIRNYLQLSNKLFVFNNTKNENKISYFKTELIKAISPQFFNDKERTSALISLCSLLNSLLPEGQPNKDVYKTFKESRVKNYARYGLSAGRWQSNKAFYSVGIDQFHREVFNKKTNKLEKKVVYKVGINCWSRKSLREKWD